MAPGISAWFESGALLTSTGPSLPELVEALRNAPLREASDGDEDGANDNDEADDSDGDGDEVVDRSTPLDVGAPFDLRLDWWLDRAAGGRDLKVWAGTMNNARIAKAMRSAMRASAFGDEALFDIGQVVNDPDKPTKKVEPFYFDARRAPNAHSRDVGFSLDALNLTVTAFPAVELLCLIGLQRFRPRPHPHKRRVFTYRAWPAPLPVEIAALAVAGAVPVPGTRTFQFENWFRTGQKKHKAFRPAVPVAEGD
jgi:CRISPR-associated protein Csb3